MNIIKKWICKLKGHNTFPPIIEVWESKNGLQRSYYLCRRCLQILGEKPYA